MWWKLRRKGIDGTFRFSYPCVGLQRFQHDIRKHGGFLVVDFFQLFVNLSPARNITRPAVLALQLYQLHLQLAQDSSFGSVLVKLAIHGLRSFRKQPLHFRRRPEDRLLRLNKW